MPRQRPPPQSEARDHSLLESPTLKRQIPRRPSRNTPWSATCTPGSSLKEGTLEGAPKNEPAGSQRTTRLKRGTMQRRIILFEQQPGHSHASIWTHLRSAECPHWTQGSFPSRRKEPYPVVPRTACPPVCARPLHHFHKQRFEAFHDKVETPILRHDDCQNTVGIPECLSNRKPLDHRSL
jgi:hypothetical protein